MKFKSVHFSIRSSGLSPRRESAKLVPIRANNLGPNFVYGSSALSLYRLLVCVRFGRPRVKRVNTNATAEIVRFLAIAGFDSKAGPIVLSMSLYRFSVRHTVRPAPFFASVRLRSL